jgi:hypothetical protein
MRHVYFWQYEGLDVWKEDASKMNRAVNTQCTSTIGENPLPCHAHWFVAPSTTPTML